MSLIVKVRILFVVIITVNAWSLLLLDDPNHNLLAVAAGSLAIGFCAGAWCAIEFDAKQRAVK